MFEYHTTKELEALLAYADPKEKEIIEAELASRQHPMFVD